MRKLILTFLVAMVVSFSYAQSSYHNYFSSATGDYIQVGFGNGYVMFRLPSAGNPFVRLNYISTNNGFRYYGDKKFQLAVNGNSSQICAIMPQYKNWYNYCGPVPNSVSPTQQNNIRRNETSTAIKCHFCNGTGRVAHNDHVPQYGTNDYTVSVKCSECGTTYMSTYTNHYHTNCGKCGGTGKIYH